MTACLLTGILLSSAAVASPDAGFASANEALSRGDVAAAESGYRALLADGYTDGDVYYNLGNVLWRRERTAHATLAWRLAAERLPRDPDVAANLDFARRTARDALDLPSSVPAFAPWQAAMTPAEGRWFGAGIAGIGLLLLALRKRAPDAPLVAVGGLALAVGACVHAGGLADGADASVAVVLVPEVTAVSDLGGGVDLFTLHAGSEVLALEISAGHVLLGLPDGRKGWVPDAAVGVAEPDRAFPAAE
jgi:hypothetical protein